MTFQEFLEIKTAQAIVEHLETLSRAEAVELLEQLDEPTIELVEAVLSEGQKRIERQIYSIRSKKPTLIPGEDEKALINKAQAKGLSVRNILRNVEIRRNQGDRTPSEVDDTRKQRGEQRGRGPGQPQASRALTNIVGVVADPRSPKLIGKVAANAERRFYKDPKNRLYEPKIDVSKSGGMAED